MSANAEFESWVDAHLDTSSDDVRNADGSINFMAFRRPEVEAAYQGHRSELGLEERPVDWSVYEI